MVRKHLLSAAVISLYALATLQFVRFYCKSTIFYLNLPAYLAGHERLPFQDRLLPALLMRPILQSPWIATHLMHANGAFTREGGAFYAVSLLGLFAAVLFTHLLYRRLSPQRLLQPLVFPLFLFAVMWSYAIHNESNYSYPYDLLSLAFFTAGLYFIYGRQFLPLCVVMIAGTANRETTLFLIGIFVLDAASPSFSRHSTSLRHRFSPSLVPWSRVVVLLAIWLAVKLSIAHHFAGNDSSECYVRMAENVHRLRPRLFPALLNMCGYLLPIAILLRREIRPTRFGNYLYILPVWVAVMFYSGVLIETRIYGELCSVAAVAVVLILEHRLERRFGSIDAEAQAFELGAKAKSVAVKVSSAA